MADKPKDILTPNEWSERQRTTKESWPTRKNIALNKGGSVDIYTSIGGNVVAVIRHVPLNDERTTEIRKHLDVAAAKAQAAVDAAKEARGEAPAAPAAKEGGK